MRKIYAAYHKNPEEVNKSSSGAMFTALSDVILKNNGKIIGGGYNYVTHRLEHIVCQTPEERDSCRGSKYIQSHIERNIYKVLEAELTNGTLLLYVGTPCQVAAVKQYALVKKLNTESLITCDILCHGVGSPGVWSKFLEWKNKEFDYLTFKDKRMGWLRPRCIAKSGNKITSLRGYSWLYFSDAIMRPVCYECNYASADRGGDFTIGDFWKVRSKVPEMYNPRGTSFIMINTDKGLDFFESVKDSLIYKEVTADDVMQNNMCRPTGKSCYRSEVMQDFRSKSPAEFFWKWQFKLLIGRIKRKVSVKCKNFTGFYIAMMK